MNGVRSPRVVLALALALLIAVPTPRARADPLQPASEPPPDYVGLNFDGDLVEMFAGRCDSAHDFSPTVREIAAQRGGVWVEIQTNAQTVLYCYYSNGI